MRAAACRECGADADTGWRDPVDLEYESVDLPEFDQDDYERVIAEMGGRRPSGASGGLPRWVVWTALAVVAAFLYAILF